MGNKIKYYRKQKGLLRKELASLSKVNIASIGNYENNKISFTNVPLENIQAIARILEVDWKEISDDYYIFINSNFGEQILSYRKQNNFSQKQLGEKVGVNECAVRLWEHNKNKPPRKLWELISK